MVRISVSRLDGAAAIQILQPGSIWGISTALSAKPSTTAIQRLRLRGFDSKLQAAPQAGPDIRCAKEARNNQSERGLW